MIQLLWVHLKPESLQTQRSKNWSKKIILNSNCSSQKQRWQHNDKRRSNRINRSVSISWWETGLYDFEGKESKGEEMTRKDYKLIAKELNHTYEGLVCLGSEAATSRIVFDGLVSRLSRKLREDNVRFDSAKFREAIYGEQDA
jgi:hypothetical protein